MNLPTNYSQYSKISIKSHYLFYFAHVFICFVSGTLNIWGLSIDELLDSIFGQTWNNHNNLYRVFISVKVVSQIAFSLMLIKWMGYSACVVSASYCCCHLLSEFNKTFSTKSASLAVLEIETYKIIHLKHCFISTLNSC